MAEQKQSAGGWGALVSSMRFLRRGGILKGGASLLRMNQPQGFDCPGCAWPEPKNTSHTEFCENGVKALAYETTAKRAGPELFRRHTVSEMRTWDDCALERTGRLTHPMAYNPATDHYEEIGWDECFRRIAAELHQLGSPDEAVFYTSGRTSNEAAFLYQLLGRLYGTNNFPDCSNMCHESSGSGLGETLGTGKGSVSLDDIHESDLVFVVGQNPGTNHPRMLSALEETKRNGGRVIAVNPLPEAGLMRFKNPQTVRGVLGKGTVIADLFVKIRPGGDLAFFRCLTG